MDEVKVRRLVDAQAGARQSITDRVVAAVLAVFGRFDGWYSEPLIAEVTAHVAAQVNAGARGIAALTDAYLAQVASEVASASVAPVGAAVSGSMRAGVPSTEAVYERVAKEFRYQASTGLPQPVAQERALERAQAMVQEDMALANQHQARRFMVVKQVDGYRRVIRPERSKTGTCGLCVAASDRVYKRNDLMPIHGGCNCEALPIINGVDPGRNLNQEDLDRIYEAAGTTDGRKLKAVRVQVVEHGELGPQLTEVKHRSRTPRDVESSQRPSSSWVKNFDSEIATLEKTYADLEARAAAGEDVARPLAYQRDRLAKLRGPASAA